MDKTKEKTTLFGCFFLTHIFSTLGFSKIFDKISEFHFVYFLDDDNIIHPEFWNIIPTLDINYYYTFIIRGCVSVWLKAMKSKNG